MNRMSMSVDEFNRKHKDSLGIVCRGAGIGIDEWISGISDLMLQENITDTNDPNKLWKSIVEIRISSNRTDLAFVINNDSIFNISKMSLWHIAFGEPWIEDYIANMKVS